MLDDLGLPAPQEPALAADRHGLAADAVGGHGVMTGGVRRKGVRAEPIAAPVVKERADYAETIPVAAQPAIELAEREADLQVQALDPLMDWLANHGPTWTQAEAERWLKALTATVDLVYPTTEAAA